MPTTRFELDEKDIQKAINFWFENNFLEPRKLRPVHLRHQSGGGDPREPINQFFASIEA